jgi:hypothetical protein
MHQDTAIIGVMNKQTSVFKNPIMLDDDDQLSNANSSHCL